MTTMLPGRLNEKGFYISSFWHGLNQTLSNIILNIYFARRMRIKYIENILLGWKIYFSMAIMPKNIFQYNKLEQLLVIALCNPA